MNLPVRGPPETAWCEWDHPSLYGTYQMADVAVPRELFAQILDKIERLKLVPDTG